MLKENIIIDDFFTHLDSFIEYRKTIYEVSEQTLKSNLCDLNLFKQFMEDSGYASITGQSVIDFQTYLKINARECRKFYKP